MLLLAPAEPVAVLHRGPHRRSPFAHQARETAVLETGAEYLVAGDNSCLLHIGGLLSRGKAGVKTIHLAEILASTEDDLMHAGSAGTQAGGVR